MAGNKCICNACGGGAFRGIKEQKGIDQKSPSSSSFLDGTTFSLSSIPLYTTEPYRTGVQFTWPKKPLEKPLEKPPENQLEIAYTGKSRKIGSLDKS